MRVTIPMTSLIRFSVGKRGRSLISPSYQSFTASSPQNTHSVTHVQPFLLRSSSSSPTSSSSFSVDDAELRKFASVSSKWWADSAGPFVGLHAMNAVRVPLIRRAILEGQTSTSSSSSSNRLPLSGFRILDVGCGGGILAEALARLGAQVTAIDAEKTNIAAARHHALMDPDVASRLDYKCITAESLLTSPRSSSSSSAAPTAIPTTSIQELGETWAESFDAVVCSEVVEHVSNVPAFLSVLGSFVKLNGGVLFITTINRTVASFASTILGAEYLLGLVPPGTHEWGKFIPPQELEEYLMASSSSLSVAAAPAAAPIGGKNTSTTTTTCPWEWKRDWPIQGLGYNPISKQWFLTNDTKSNYAFMVRKVVIEQKTEIEPQEVNRADEVK